MAWSHHLQYSSFFAHLHSFYCPVTAKKEWLHLQAPGWHHDHLDFKMISLKSGAEIAIFGPPKCLLHGASACHVALFLPSCIPSIFVDFGKGMAPFGSTSLTQYNLSGTFWKIVLKN